MSEDLNSNSGKISGNPSRENTSDGKISGNNNIGINKTGKISGNNSDDTFPNSDSVSEKETTENIATSRKERITFATVRGLKILPLNFGDTDGDWQTIESDDLFEVLYLDQEKITLIDPSIIKNNFSLIESFWKEKRNLWESGSGQIRKTIEDKYG